MRNPLSFLRRLKRVGVKLKRRQAHREIAVIGPRDEHSRRLAELLFLARATEGETPPISDGARTVAKAVSCPASGESSADAAYRGLFLPPGGRRRPRWWFARLARCNEASEAVEEGDWQRESDTFLICLPFDDIRGRQLQRDNLDYHMPLSVGRARSQGRLRRVAVVVTGLPEEFGPHHACQVRCDVPRHIDLATGLRSRINAADGRAGDPLADPVWSSFMLKYLVKNNGFVELYEVTRRAAGRDCPVFFIPDQAERIGAQVPLLEWIHGVKAPHSRTRGRLAAGLALLGVGLLAAVLSLAWAVPPPLHEEQVRELVAELVESPEDGRLRAALEGLAARYSDRTARWFSLDRGPVMAALGAVRDYEIRGGLRRLPVRRAVALRAEIDETESGLRAAMAEARVAGRGKALASLRGLLRNELGLRRAWVLQAAQRGIDASAATVWDSRIEEIAVLCGLLAIQLQGEGLGELAADGELLDEVMRALDEVGRSKTARQLEGLFIESASVAFYRRYADLIESGATAAFERFVAHLPRPDAAALVSAVEGLSLAELATRREEVEAYLEGIVALGAISLGDGPGRVVLVETAVVAAAREVLACIDDALKPREMVIVFTRPKDADWHLDIRVGKGPYRPTSVPHESASSEYRLRSGRFGQRLAVALNEHDGVHKAQPGRRCARSRTGVFLLDRRQGSLRFGRSIVHYEVISGWPEWSPRSSGVMP